MMRAPERHDVADHQSHFWVLRRSADENASEAMAYDVDAPVGARTRELTQRGGDGGHFRVRLRAHAGVVDRQCFAAVVSEPRGEHEHGRSIEAPAVNE